MSFTHSKRKRQRPPERTSSSRSGDTRRFSRGARSPTDSSKAVNQPIVCETFESVWDAICDTSGEAQHMRTRSELMIALAGLIRSRRLSQARAAKLLGVTQPRVSDLMTGKINRFSVDSLMEMLARAGMIVTVQVRPAA